MHELGHAVGLGHSGDTGSVMYAFLAPGATRRLVTAQDLTVLEASTDSGPEPLLAAPPRWVSTAALSVTDAPNGASGNQSTPSLLGLPGSDWFHASQLGEAGAPNVGQHSKADSQTTSQDRNPDPQPDDGGRISNPSYWGLLTDFGGQTNQLLEKGPSESLLSHSRLTNAQDLDDFWSSFTAARLFANTL
jgi:hypothetical protein